MFSRSLHFCSLYFGFYFCFCFFLIFGSNGTAVSVFAEDRAEEIAAIEKRAKEIEPMLGARFCVLPSISDREFWEKTSKEPSFKNVIRGAEKALETPVPVVPDELYLEFTQNGNRTDYQDAYGRRNRPLGLLVFAECFENQGRFIPRIEEQLRAYFNDRSWVLPAHDRNLDNFNGSYTVDLVSSATAWMLATIDSVLGDKLSPEIRKELDEQLEVRCFKPFRSHILTGKPSLWWVRGINNWNAVCLAGVTGAALTHLSSKADRAWFAAAAEKFILNSNIGYTDDGYCTEGVGYWCYGFGNHFRLSEILRRATDGKIQVLNDPKLRKVALYGFSIEILPGFSPSFADCGLTAAPEHRLLAVLNRYYDFQRNDYDYTFAQKSVSLNDFGIFSNNLPEIPAENPSRAIKRDFRTWFPSAQIMVLRPIDWMKTTENLSDSKATRLAEEALDGFAAAMKGGNNGEQHNHNDVGSYVLLYRATLPALDLGGEVYTRRTFSKDRYESDVLNSWGHNVPVVAGTLQKTGADACATVQKADFSKTQDVFKIEFSAAYSVKECESLTREFVYSRDKTQFSVEDEVKFSTPQTFETAMVTILAWKRDGNEVIFGEGEKAVRAKIEVKIDGKVSDDWTLNDAGYKADFSANDVARRLGIHLNQPIKNASVRITYTPSAL